MPEFWIQHPATQDGPVSFRRWIAWQIAERLYRWYTRLEWFALHGNAPPDDDIPF